MESTGATKPKLGKGFTVRLDPLLRGKIDGLAGDTKRDLSDIVRDGLMAFWPEIEALNRQLAPRATPEDIAKLRAWMDAGREAHALDIDLPSLLRREVASRAATRAEAEPAAV